jgi:hypothetical protein
MAIVSEDRAVSPGAMSQAGAMLRIFALRMGPIVMALVVEPWSAVAVALDIFRRSPRLQDRIHRQRHVVNASVTLLGLAAAIIATLAITNESAHTWSDEVAWMAAGFMLGSIWLSHSGTRGGIGCPIQMRMADGAFLAGISAILLSLLAAAWQLPR